jgi:hypothetical protein
LEPCHGGPRTTSRPRTGFRLVCVCTMHLPSCRTCAPSELVSFPGSSGGRPGQLTSSLVSILASYTVPSSHKREVDAVFAREGSSRPECEHLSLARSKAESQAALSVGGTGARDCFVLVSGACVICGPDSSSASGFPARQFRSPNFQFITKSPFSSFFSLPVQLDPSLRTRYRCIECGSSCANHNSLAPLWNVICTSTMADEGDNGTTARGFSRLG